MSRCDGFDLLLPCRLRIALTAAVSILRVTVVTPEASATPPAAVSSSHKYTLAARVNLSCNKTPAPRSQASARRRTGCFADVIRRIGGDKPSQLHRHFQQDNQPYRHSRLTTLPNVRNGFTDSFLARYLSQCVECPLSGELAQALWRVLRSMWHEVRPKDPNDRLCRVTR